MPKTLHMIREVCKTISHMIFSDLKILHLPCIQPSNIIHYSVKSYVQILNRNRSVFSIHKALIDSREISATKPKSLQHDNIVNLIDHTNDETMKYCDQNNVYSMKEIFNKNKANLTRTRFSSVIM